MVKVIIRTCNKDMFVIKLNENFNFIELITINLDESLGLQIEIYGM